MFSFSWGDVPCFALNAVIALMKAIFGTRFQIACKDAADIICGPVVLPVDKVSSVFLEVTFFWLLSALKQSLPPLLFLPQLGGTREQIFEIRLPVFLFKCLGQSLGNFNLLLSLNPVPF